MIDTNFIFGYEAGKAAGGTPAPVLEQLSVTANGEYTPSGIVDGYSSVVANVPNTYLQTDEGKVVSDGALVAQTTTSVTENGTVDTTTISSVIVNVPQGGGSAPENDVVFFDYDGTVVYNYSAADFANLTAMPANPTHTGLTAQGWNWTLADAKTYVASYGSLNIGQMYVTDDGKTRIHIKLEEGRCTPYLKIAVKGTCDVDWGDGTTHDTLTGNNVITSQEVPHTYAMAGEYTIVIYVTEGSIGFPGPMISHQNLPQQGEIKAYKNGVRRAELGGSIENIGSSVFQDCASLASVTIPRGITSVGSNMFTNCYALPFVTIPSGITGIGDYTFSACSALLSVAIPNTVTSIGNSAFSGCSALTFIAIPSSVTSLGNSAFSSCFSLSSVTMTDSITSFGTNVFFSCYSLCSIILPSGITRIESNTFNACYSLVSVTIPNNITSIESSAFYNCYALHSLSIPNTVTGFGSSAFSGCRSLSSVTIPSGVTSIPNSLLTNCYSLVSITIPSGVTSIGNNAFANCCALSSVEIPNTVTSFGTGVFSSCYALPSVTIPSGVTSISVSNFSTCRSLSSIIIPSGVTSIGKSAFSSCSSLGFIKFEPTAPPTAVDSTVFNGLRSDCIIYVPSGYLSAYQTATNYPNPNTFTYVEY